MENRWQTMAEGEFDFGFAVDWMRKDLGICLDEARRNGARLPVTALVDQFYAQVAGGAAALGHVEPDPPARQRLSGQSVPLASRRPSAVLTVAVDRSNRRGPMIFAIRCSPATTAG